MNPLWKALNYWRRRQIHSLRSPPSQKRPMRRLKSEWEAFLVTFLLKFRPRLSLFIPLEQSNSGNFARLLEDAQPPEGSTFLASATFGRILSQIEICLVWGKGWTHLCSLSASKVECLAEAAFLRPSELWGLCISPPLFICRPFKTLS